MALLLRYFQIQEQTLVTGIQNVDVMSTAKSMSEKLLQNIPSFTRVSTCKNLDCINKKKYSHCIILSLNVVNNIINLQENIDEIFDSTEEKCIEEKCTEQRSVVIEPMSYLLIELTNIPEGNNL